MENFEKTPKQNSDRGPKKTAGMSEIEYNLVEQKYVDLNSFTVKLQNKNSKKKLQPCTKKNRRKVQENVSFFWSLQSCTKIDPDVSNSFKSACFQLEA